MQEKPNFTQDPSSRKISGQSLFAFYASIALFIVVAVVTGVFVGITSYTKSSSEKIAQENKEIATKIKIAKEKKEIIVVDILQKNEIRPSIDLKNIVENFRKAAVAARVQFQGFSIKNDEITTHLISLTSKDSTRHSDPAYTIIEMMKEYAGEVEGSFGDKDFTLVPISHISGDTTMRTADIKFIVKPNTLKVDTGTETSTL